MDISSISNAIKAIFTDVRTPAPKIPGLLMAIGGIQKPGISTTYSVGKIVETLNKHNIPTDPMPDGSENKTVQLVIAIVDEIYRALREDANIQISFLPGMISVLTMGANSGGPVVSQGVNINFPEGNAVLQ